MNYKMLAVGNGTYAFAERVAVITKFESARIKKEVAGLREGDNSSKLIDASKHKTVKSVIVLENGTHILSNLSPETLVKRLMLTVRRYLTSLVPGSAMGHCIL